MGEGCGPALTALGPTGRVAAQNMLAQEAEISTVPYLWTAMFGKSLRYAGIKGGEEGGRRNPWGGAMGWEWGLEHPEAWARPVFLGRCPELAE